MLDTPPRLPIKLEPVSNGEYIPRPLTPDVSRAREVAFREAGELARRRGISRREFLTSSCGVATTLLAMNASLGCGGGHYAVPKSAALDEDQARAAVGGSEFIFDVQTHHITPGRPWPPNHWIDDFLAKSPAAACGDKDYLSCFARDDFLREVFLESDTQVAVLSALAGAPADNPLLIEEAAQTREQVEKLGRGGRLLLHGIVMPNLDPIEEQLEGMQALVEQWGVSAFKIYTVWGPDGKGFWLDDPKRGIPVIERARQLGVRILCVHKGLPLPGMDPTFTRCRDVGVVAKAFPDMSFMIYHSGFEDEVTEGAYNPKADKGIDGLLRSLAENGVGRNANVYAELGSLWRELMKRPDEAAHALGKLLRHVGEDRVIWGTDAIWYGSPQDQIQAFRAFEITPSFQEKHSYPALTRELKAKIFGGNAAPVYGVEPRAKEAALAEDLVARTRLAYREETVPTFDTYGPRNRTELFNLIRRQRGLPG